MLRQAQQEGNSNSGTSVDFLKQLKGKHPGPLLVIWDNALAHRGEAMREYLRTPGLELRLVNLPGYSPDLNADEAIWGWAREEATGNLCLGTKAAVQERVGRFLDGLVSRRDEVRRRCRTILQSRAEALPPQLPAEFPASVKCTHIPPWLWFRIPEGSHRIDTVSSQPYLQGYSPSHLSSDRRTTWGHSFPDLSARGQDVNGVEKLGHCGGVTV